MFPHELQYAIVISEIMWLVGSKPIKSNVTRPTTSFSRIIFCVITNLWWWSIFFINDVISSALWHHLSSLPYQFSIFEDVGGGLTALWSAQTKERFTLSLTAINWQLLDCIVIKNSYHSKAKLIAFFIMNNISIFQPTHISLPHWSRTSHNCPLDTVKWKLRGFVTFWKLMKYHSILKMYICRKHYIMINTLSCTFKLPAIIFICFSSFLLTVFGKKS